MSPDLRVVGLILALALPGVAEDVRRDVEYARAGGERLLLDAATPSAGPSAAVILVHGGGWSQGSKANGIEPLAGALAEAGIAWFSIDYRLAPKHVYPAQVEDVAAAVRFVADNADRFRVDRKRIFLAGFSAGGHLAALTAMSTKAGRELAGVMSFYGRMDLVRGYETPGPAVAAIRGLLGLAPDAKPGHPLLREASPILHIRPDLPPFLLVHGTADDTVPVEDSRRMCSALQRAGVACAFLPIEGGNHGMGRWKDLGPAGAFTEQTIEWIQTVAGEIPVAAKGE